MKKIKKLLALLLCLAVIFAILPLGGIPVFAATSGTTGDCTWEFDGSTLTIRGNGAMKDYTSNEDEAPWIDLYSDISNVIIEYGVTHIGDWAFGKGFYSGDEMLNSVTIELPDSVTSIGESAFCDFVALTSITIPDSVIDIGEGAFLNCHSLTAINVAENNPSYCSADGVFFNKDKTVLITYPARKVGDDYTVPDGVIEIYDSAFCDSGLTYVTIPDSVENIGYRAFVGCESLVTVTIGSGLSEIGQYAFRCDNLQNFVVIESNESFSSVDGVLFNKDKSTLLYYPAGKTATSYSIPDSVTYIGDSAFESCDSLNFVTIPSNVSGIGFYAFSGSGLLSVTLPEGLTSIEGSSFRNCYQLCTVCLPSTVTDIGYAAFSESYNLSDVYFDGTIEQLKSINVNEGNECFTNATIHLSDGTTVEGFTPEGSEDSGSDDSSDIPTSGTTGDCTWKLDGTVLTISGSGAMAHYEVESAPWGKDITEVNISDGVISVGSFAFEFCYNLTSVTLGNSVTHIYECAFQECNNLMDVSLYNSINYIGSNSFANCSAISTVHFDGTIQEWNSLEFGNSDDKVNLEAGCVYCSDGTIDSSKESDDSEEGGSEDGGSDDGDDELTECNHNFIDGVCDKCGSKQLVLENLSVEEPPFNYNGEYIYDTYSATFENASSVTVTVPETDSTDDTIYIYDADYNLIGSYTYSDFSVIVESETVRMKIVSWSDEQTYNATLIAEYDYEKGDISGDCEINADDLVLFRKQLLGNAELMTYQYNNADINSDGACNLKDFVALKKVLAGINS